LNLLDFIREEGPDSEPVRAKMIERSESFICVIKIHDSMTGSGELEGLVGSPAGGVVGRLVAGLGVGGLVGSAAGCEVGGLETSRQAEDSTVATSED
jgi:hypothetical protein